MRVLGIDIGGTKTIVGVLDETGRIISQKRVETPGALGPQVLIDRIKAACRDALLASREAADVIGIGCGGPLDRKSGTLHAVPNLPGWDGLRLTRIFGEDLGAPAYLDNDATAAALGELMFGAGKGVAHFVYFTISTGIGGGIIIDGKPYRGYGENAGEFGHQKLTLDGPPCSCGDRGCLEALASGTGIARRARELLIGMPETVLWEWISDADEVTAELVARAAGKGDEFAAEVWERAMHALGLGVANAVNILNPQRVIMGGGVTKSGHLLFGPVRRIVGERAMPSLATDVDIVPAANGDLVGLMGAAAVALEAITS